MLHTKTKKYADRFIVPRVAEMELLGTRSSVRLIWLSGSFIITVCDSNYRFYVYKLTDKIINGTGVVPFRLKQCFTTVREICMSHVDTGVPCLNLRTKVFFCTTRCQSLCCVVGCSTNYFQLRTAAFKAYCAIWVRRSNFRHQVSPRVSPRENAQRRKVELWARNVLEFFLNADFHVTFRDLLLAVKLWHGTDGFTSLPKEGVMWIFFALKIRRLRPGANPRTWVPKTSTLPLDHRSRFIRQIAQTDKQ
jgi:hypothetical protein